MWKVKDFFDNWDSGWFAHRFRNTVFLRDENKHPYYLQEVGRRADGRTVLTFTNAITERGRRVLKEDAADWECGVPEHGWAINEDGDMMYIPRRFYDKWKWGWVPRNDTHHPCWRALINPQHAGFDDVFNMERDEEVFNYDYARRGNEFYYQEYVVGSLVDGTLIIDPAYEHVFYDTLLDIPKRIA